MRARLLVAVLLLALGVPATDATAKHRHKRIATGPCPVAKKHHKRRKHRRKLVCPKVSKHARTGSISKPKSVVLTTAPDALPRRTGYFQGKGTEELNPEQEGYVAPRHPGLPRPANKRGNPIDVQSAAATRAPSAHASAGIVKVFESHHPGMDLWETSGASDGPTVMFTGNWWAWGSNDGGNSFYSIDPYTFMGDQPERFCCDQVVQYDPTTDLFIWLLQTEKQESPIRNTIRIAVATSTQFYASKGKAWTYWDFYPSDFGFKGVWMDYSELAIGKGDLIWSVSAIGTGGSLLTRIPLSALAKGGTIPYEWFWDGGNLHPAQQTGSRTYFAREKDDSTLTFYSWDEGSNTIHGKDIAIPTIAESNWVTKFPNNQIAIADSSKINSKIQTGALSGNEAWFAWSAGRDVRGKPTWPQPHTEIAVINVTSRTLDRMEYMWNPDHVWVWPAFSVNDQGEIGASFVWGGKDVYTQYVVGIMTPLRWITDVTTGVNASGGHYITTRPRYPVGRCFAGFGFGAKQIGVSNDAYYAVFGRDGSQCELPPINVPLPPGEPLPLPKPNLVVDSLTSQAGTGQGSFTIKNAGAADAPASTAHSQIGMDTASGHDYAVPALAAGAATAPIALAGGCPPSALVPVTADSTAAVAESDETDNARSITCP
jgi:hypothetical protein